MEAQNRGAKVIFITGESGLAPETAEVIRVRSADDMLKAALKNSERADIVIGAAAVGDFTVIRTKGKIKRGKAGLVLRLLPTTDILAEISEKKGGRIMVGFSAESGFDKKRAIAKLKKKKLDLVVLNDISRPGLGFASDENEIAVFDRRGRKVLEKRGSKQELACAIIDKIEGLIR